MKRVPMICKIASSVMAITSMVMPLIGVAQEPKVSSKYTLFAPSMNKQQTIDIQKKIDTQLLLKTGGQQISPTQVAYDNGGAVITFAVTSTPNTTCDFGYVCFWEHNNYVGKKLSLRSHPTAITVNLAQYDMSNKISSWRHNNNLFYVAIGGASQANGGGQMVMANTMDDYLGGGCCPFAIEHSTRHATPPEFYFRPSLKYDNAMVSVVFKPYPW
ncbi:hypothetical protein PS874_04622 [Pseudomonas fluorescens]|nr:peptidase inhibitor family I36 protein [Pseudomonas silesiensis]VVP39014.1 hypothetical protein PS874_04622 [Pseudomonas fluorescens]